MQSDDVPDDSPSLADEILRELHESPIVPAPANPEEDRLPFDPAKVSLRTLMQHANQYRNHEPLLAQVMVEILGRDHSAYQLEVRALQWRWQYLVRIAQPATWPDSAIEREEKAFHGRCFQCGDQGMLAFFGYHVGMTQGLIMPVRRSILDYIYRGRLPLVSDVEYTRSWGEPCSSHRLKKLASTLAHLARNAIARENPNYATAISEWEADLQYVKSMYFRPHDNPDHDWEWPRVSVY